MDDDVLAEFAASASRDLGAMLNRAGATVGAEVFRRVAERGYADVKRSHVAVFAGLEAGGTRITTLAEHAGISRQAMSALVSEVEQLGYVESSADPSDARATLVRLTARGVAFCRAAMAASAEVTEEVGAILGESVERFREELRSIASWRGEPTEG
jgi:DNA-binding MarR family transcriptional regulator